MRLFFTLFEAPWSQWPLHRVYNEKLKKTGPETENGIKLCTSCLNAWNKLPSCQPRSQGSLLSTLRSKERTLGTRLPSCLQQGWGNNVFNNKLSHVLTHSHFQSNYPVVMLVFAPAVSDIFHHFTFLLIGMFIWRTISVQGRTDPLETQLYIRIPVQMSGVPLLL